MSLKSDTLKLSPILAQFLYLNKELNLAGIGKFRMEPSPEQPDSSEKNLKNEPPGNISFYYDSSVKEDESLIDFISLQTGKMKSLAASDLDSHLELAKQFLNIGKPFFIEGIGTLTKNRFEKLDFVPGNFSDEKNKDHEGIETDQPSTTEESFTDYEEMLSPKQRATPFSRKLVLWLAIITGIGLAIWGGYLIYKKTNTIKQQTVNKPETEPVGDTTINSPFDSTSTKTNLSDSTESYFKYVIENADSNRAFLRYNDLKNYGLDILMETKDSITYKLYFRIASSPADTARIRDSLNIWYGTRSKTTIEN